MPDTVISRVNELGKDQPEHLAFTDRQGRTLGDVEITGVDEAEASDNGTVADKTPQIEIEHEFEYAPDAELVDQEQVDLPKEPQVPLIEEPIDVETVEGDDDKEDDDTPAVTFKNDEPAQQPMPDETEETPGVRRSTRTKSQPKQYIPTMTGNKYEYVAAQMESEGILHPDTHMFFQQAILDSPDTMAAIMTQLALKVGMTTAAIMTQLSLKSGMKQWGSKASVAVLSEMKQLHFRDTFKPKHWHELSQEQKECVLESHMFLKQKRDGNIKGRTVAGGNKQRDFISKEDASSPTVATESVLLTCIIDAEEERDVAVIDIPNAFIQTRIENESDMAIIKIRGTLVDMLLQIAPEVYQAFVTTDKKGNKQLIVQCQNAIYGTMVASLLYYRKFRKSLESFGFTFNPYDPCVANKVVNGTQMTICFHVDDCKLSHKEKQENDKMIEWLRIEYESIFEDGSGKMTVSRGNIHKYLGMTLDFTTRRQVKITMFDYVDEILEAFDKAEANGGGTKSSAAPDNLFTVDADCMKLKPNKAKDFHTIVAKTLYVTKRARPDTCTAVAFLTTRVRTPDLEDWSKLTHLMKYLRSTRDLPLILSSNGSGILKWWIDGSFATHPNMRGHTGGGLSMGRGFPIVNSTKQKLNTRSSTETEVVSVDDCMPAVCWTRYFMEAQGYMISENIVYQDNKSASKRTKHINIRYYFVTDRIEKGEMSVAWCPTADMIADFMTKPTQGAMFKRFRDQIMGVIPPQSPGKGKPKRKAGP
jgi:hypothetical protein